MIVKKGMSIELNSWACHHCPDFFPDPKVFKPERFLKENSADIINHTFRGFGGNEVSAKNDYKIKTRRFNSFKKILNVL